MAKASREYVYGINPVSEVLRARRRRMFEAYVNEELMHRQRIRELVDLCKDRDVSVRMVGARRLIELSGSKDHQGIVLKTTTYPYVSSNDIIGNKRLLLLDNVEDPQNVGGIVRSAEVFGFKSILLPNKGCPDVYPSVVKVSAGATEFLDIARDASATKYAVAAKQAGHAIISLDASGTTDVRDLAEQLPDKYMVVIGGENKGVGRGVMEQTDFVCSIKQQGSINSLNASVAAGIALHALA